LKPKGIEESELPVVVLGEFFEHGTHAGFSVGIARIAGRSATGSTIKFQEFGNEELRAAAIDVEGFSFEELVSGPAQIVEREPGVTAQKFASRLERILHRAVGAGEGEHEAVDVFTWRRQDNFHFARGEKLFGEALDEPGRRLCGVSASITIGQFEQQHVCDCANVFAASHDVRQLDKIFPAVAEAFAVNGDRGIGPWRELEGEMDSATPWCGIGEFAIEDLFDALGGNGEHGGVEDDQGRVGAEAGGGFGRACAARVMDEELAAETASESVIVLGERGIRNEQEQTE
jgi:hypothetical protein